MYPTDRVRRVGRPRPAFAFDTSMTITRVTKCTLAVTSVIEEYLCNLGTLLVGLSLLVGGLRP